MLRILLLLILSAVGIKMLMDTRSYQKLKFVSIGKGLYHTKVFKNKNPFHYWVAIFSGYFFGFLLVVFPLIFIFFIRPTIDGNGETVYANKSDITVYGDENFVSMNDPSDLKTSLATDIKIAGYTPDSTIFTAKEVGGKLQILPDAKKGVETIDSFLSAQKAIIVGVDYKIGKPGASDGTTDHYVVIDGYGRDTDGNKYYHYMDSGTRVQAIGVSPQNRLFLNKDYSLTGTSIIFKGALLTVTQVKP